jgi:hypothetical protein
LVAHVERDALPAFRPEASPRGERADVDLALVEPVGAEDRVDVVYVRVGHGRSVFRGPRQTPSNERWSVAETTADPDGIVVSGKRSAARHTLSSSPPIEKRSEKSRQHLASQS